MTRQKFDVGDKVVCTKAMSGGYEEGKVYEVILTKAELPGLQADDGFEDTFRMMVSVFKLHEKAKPQKLITDRAKAKNVKVDTKT
jgi:hypothetical protein